jgi:uncharacterized protein
MIVMAVKVDARISGCFSLKDKRSVVKSIVESLSHKFRISIAEVGKNDSLHETEIGFSMVSSSRSMLESSFERIIEIFDTVPEFVQVDFDREFHYM